MSVISVTRVYCDDIEQRLRAAGVIETVELTGKSGNVAKYQCINRKACDPKAWDEYARKRYGDKFLDSDKALKNLEYYPVQFRDEGNTMISIANYGSAWNVAEFAARVLNDEVIRVSESTEGHFKPDEYIKGDTYVTAYGRPIGDTVTHVSPKLIRPLDANPAKSVFILPMDDKNGKGDCRTTIINTMDAWPFSSDKGDGYLTVNFDRDKPVTLYNSATKEKSEVSSKEFIKMFENSRETYKKRMQSAKRIMSSQISSFEPEAQDDDALEF